MSQFEIRQPISIPYFDHNDSFFGTIRNSARRRGRSPVAFLFRKLLNICLFRISYFCPLNSIRIRCHKWRGVNIGKNVYIGVQCTIDNAYPEYIYIEDNVSIASECYIIAHSNPYEHFQSITASHVAPVIIKRGSWLCARSLILPGVTIGVYAVVSAGAVISSDVPQRSVASGNPAKIIATNLTIN